MTPHTNILMSMWVCYFLKKKKKTCILNSKWLTGCWESDMSFYRNFGIWDQGGVLRFFVTMQFLFSGLWDCILRITYCNLLSYKKSKKKSFWITPNIRFPCGVVGQGITCQFGIHQGCQLPNGSYIISVSSTAYQILVIHTLKAWTNQRSFLEE